MSKSNNLYTMMRLSYEQAVDDYNDKKVDSVLSAYKKYHIINVGMALILLIILTFCGHYVNYSTKTKQNIQ